jgi:nucleotide-binding universal stress UspA family protein
MRKDMPTETEFGRILVAFDGSKDSQKAIGLACSLALKFGSELTVVQVFSSPSIGYSATSGMPIPDYKMLEDAKKAAAKEVLSKGLQLAKQEGVEAKGELIEAPSVVEALVEFAVNKKADLIVTGTRGMTGFKKLVLGSVSSGLVNHAHCPVLIAR